MNVRPCTLWMVSEGKLNPDQARTAGEGGLRELRAAVELTTEACEALDPPNPVLSVDAGQDNLEALSRFNSETLRGPEPP